MGSDYFLFTKSLEVRFINIEAVKEKNEQIYIVKEKPNSRLEDKNNYLYQPFYKNIPGMAIYSIPDLILLKANKMYLDYFTVPNSTYKTTFGKQIHEFVAGWKGSAVEDSWRNIIARGKAEHVKEFKYDKPEYGTKYWDATITPVFDSGSIKYIVVNAHDVTEGVLSKKQLEEKNKIIENQKKELEAVLDNIHGSMYVFDKSGQYIIINKEARKFSKYTFNKIGDNYRSVKCYDLDGKEVLLNEMPTYCVRNEETIKDKILGFKLDREDLYKIVNGTPIFDDKGEFLYGVISECDITDFIKNQKVLKDTEEQLLETEREKNEILEKAIEMKDDFLSAISHEYSMITQNLYCKIDRHFKINIHIIEVQIEMQVLLLYIITS